MSYPIKIIKGDKHRHVMLRVVGTNVRGVPSKFELVDDDQPVDVTSGEEVFVAATVPVQMMEGSI